MRPATYKPRRQSSRHERGFTLVELLVVIAIIGVLVGLLLPAVQAARESARRNACLNNMRNVALGMAQYDNSFGKLPGYVNEVRNPNAANAARRASWVVLLFPYLEQQALWDKWSKELPNTTTSGYVEAQWQSFDAVNGTAPELPILLCQSDTTTAETPGQPNLSFVVNAGHAYTATDRTSSNEQLANGVFFNLAGQSGIGPSSSNLRSSFDYVQTNDGTSNTVMISENLHAQFWAYDNSGPSGQALDFSDVEDRKSIYGFVWHVTAPFSEVRRINGTVADAPDSLQLPSNMLSLYNPTEQDEVFAYPTSNHPGGVNMAFVDSHIVFMAESIELRVYAQLMTSNRKRSSLVINNVQDRNLQQPTGDDF